MMRLLILLLLINIPQILSANQSESFNTQWATDKIYVFEEPFVDSKKKKLENYKKYDSYNVTACNKFGWCISKDGYVKNYLLKFYEFVPVVEDLSIYESQIEPRDKESRVSMDLEFKKQTADNSIDLDEESKLESLDIEHHQNNDNFENILESSFSESNDILKSYDKKVEIQNNSENTIELTLVQLIQEVIIRNSSLENDRLQNEVIDNRLVFEGSIFIPKVYFNLNTLDSNVPNNTQEALNKGLLETYTEKSNTIQLGMMGILPSGAQWDASINSQDKETSVIKEYKDYDTEYENSFKFSFQQPLLKGAGADITLAKYNLTKYEKVIFENQYKKNVMDAIARTIQIYWRLYGAKQIEKSYTRSIKLNQDAEKLLEQKMYSGEVSYSEVLETKSASLSRKAELKKIKSEIIRLQNDLLTFLNVPIDKNEHINFQLVDQFDNGLDKKMNLMEYYQMAIENLPEYLMLKDKLQREELKVELAKDQIKPQLDFVSSLSTATLNDEREDKFQESNYLTWSIGLQFNMPLYFDQAKSALEIAKINKKQMELEIKSLDIGLLNAIDTKFKILKNAKEQVGFYEEGLKIKQELLDHMQKSFILGEKSIRDVLVQQEDIISYERKLYSTIIDWKIAQASLDKAVGSLFDKYVTFELLDKSGDKELSDVLDQKSFSGN